MFIGISLAIVQQRGGGGAGVLSDASAIIDFESERFYWDGTEHTIADLTPVSTSYSANAAAAAFQTTGFTVMVEWTTPPTLAADLYLFTLGWAADAPTNRFEVVVSSGDVGQPFLYLNPPNQNYTPDMLIGAETDVIPMMGRRRAIFSVANAAVPLLGSDGFEVNDNGSIVNAGAPSFDKLGIGYRAAFDDQVSPVLPHKIWMWSTLKSAAECVAILEQANKTPIHMLSDSFGNGKAYSDGGGFTDRLRKRAAVQGRAYVTWSEDCAGGNTMTQHAARYAANGSQHYPKNLLIFEGGLDGTGEDAVIAVQDMLTHCTRDWVVVEPTYASDKPAGSPERATLDAAISTLRTYADSHWIETLDGMQAASDGSANDLTDVANDIVPRSLQEVDGIHDNSAGQDVRSAIILDALVARGWFGAGTAVTANTILDRAGYSVLDRPGALISTRS